MILYTVFKEGVLNSWTTDKRLVESYLSAYNKFSVYKLTYKTSKISKEVYSELLYNPELAVKKIYFKGFNDTETGLYTLPINTKIEVKIDRMVKRKMDKISDGLSNLYDLVEILKIQDYDMKGIKILVIGLLLRGEFIDNMSVYIELVREGRI